MYKFVYGFLLVIVLGSSGCSDWLDVQPKTSVPEEDLFADEFGFQDALTGFYLKMGESSLYGRELTYNYMEMLAGRYEYAPDITNWTSIYNYDGTYKSIKGEFYQFNLSSCIRQQNSLTAQFVSFSLSNLANIFYPPPIFTIINLCLL